MSIYSQVEALNQMRRIVNTHFPHASFRVIEDHLAPHLEIDGSLQVDFDEGRQAYKVWTAERCKVCDARDSLLKIPLVIGQLFLCEKCQKDIVAAGTLASGT